MRQLNIALLTVMLAATAFLCSCRDDDDDNNNISGENWTVTVLGGSAAEVTDDGNVFFGRNATYGSLRLQIGGYNAQRDGQIMVSLQEGAEWLSLDADTLNEEGIISLVTQDNDDSMQRSATLLFTASTGTPQQSTTLIVRQRSSADNDSNGEDAKSELYIGYGYDIFKSLDNPMSVRTKTPILDLQKLRNLGSNTFYEPIHDSKLSRLEMKYTATATLYKYSEELTKQQAESEYDLAGCRADCELVTKVSKGNLDEQNFGRGSLIKLVAARVIDKGVLNYLQRNNNMPYTSEFLKRVNNLLTMKDLNKSNYAEEVTKTLEEYGTHMVIQADLGGRIDYTFTMQKTSSFFVTDELKEEIDYTIGRKSQGERSPGFNKEVSSTKNVSGAIKVTGGSAESRKMMKDDIAKLGTTSQLPPEHITAWLGSITYDDRALAAGDIDVVHFELIPLWDLVPDKLRNDFINATLRMVERPDCKVPDEKLGTDLYTIDCTRKDLFDFSGVGDDGSLCRILYLTSGEEKAQTPVLQVCSEYVPKIRTDQRVTIAYPIYKQKIRMNEGIFLGDGIHQPAFVGFGGSDCFVSPISTLKTTDIIQHLCYVNGSLSIETKGIQFISEDKRNRIVKDDVFYFRMSPKTFRYPIVKIGAQFWTRRDVDHKMGLALSPSSDRTLDNLKDGVLYARYWHDLGRTTAGVNKWLWGYEPNTLFEGNPNMKWYFPSGDDVRNLHAFLGFNPKALFKGQVSGYNAQFNGYYGGYDIVNKKATSNVQVRAKGEMNTFATRNTTNDRTSVLLVLDKNYQLYEAENGPDGSWRENYYPVRAVRGYMFNYPLLNAIEDFEKKYK